AWSTSAGRCPGRRRRAPPRRLGAKGEATTSTRHGPWAWRKRRPPREQARAAGRWQTPRARPWSLLRLFQRVRFRDEPLRPGRGRVEVDRAGKAQPLGDVLGRERGPGGE